MPREVQTSTACQRLAACEAALVGHVVLTGDHEVLRRFAEADLIDPTARIAWKRLRSLSDEGKPISRLSALACTEVPHTYWERAFKAGTGAGSQAPRELQVQRAAVELRGAGLRLAQEADRGCVSGRAAGQIIHGHIERIHELSCSVEFSEAAPGFAGAWDDWCTELEHPKLSTSLSYGVHSVDRRIGGLRASTLNLVLGGSAHGKSCWGLQAAMLAAKQGVPAYILSVEMSGLELLKRGAAWDLNRPLNEVEADLQRGDTATREHVESLSRLPICVESRDRSVAGIHAALSSASADNPYGLVVADFIQHMTGSNPKADQHERLEEIAYSLKHAAQFYGVPVVAMVQPNRQADLKAPPSMTQIRGASGIENSADSIVSVFRGDAAPGCAYPLKVDIAKARNGRPGPVNGEFLLGAGTFRVEEIRSRHEVIS